MEKCEFILEYVKSILERHRMVLEKSKAMLEWDGLVLEKSESVWRIVRARRVYSKEKAVRTRAEHLRLSAIISTSKAPAAAPLALSGASC